jgi:hypothetical protein
LHADQLAIEREFGEPLDWHELPDKKSSRISIYRTGIEPLNPAAYDRMHEWMLARMEAFRAVFSDRVRTLSLGQSIRQVDEADAIGA